MNCTFHAFFRVDVGSTFVHDEADSSVSHDFWASLAQFLFRLMRRWGRSAPASCYLLSRIETPSGR